MCSRPNEPLVGSSEYRDKQSFVRRKTFKELVSYLKKDKPLERLRREEAATILQFGKVFLATVSFVQGFPCTIHGVSKCDVR